MANRPQLFSGARGQFSVTRTVDGNPVATVFAFSTDISVNVRHAVRPSFVIGDMNAIAIDSLSYDVDVSVGRLVPVNSGDPTVALQTAGTGVLDPAGSPIAPTHSIASGMELSINTILASDDIFIDIIDRTTSQTLASIKGCRFAGRSQSLNAQDVLQERLNFVGIYDAGYGGTAQTPSRIGYDTSNA